MRMQSSMTSHIRINCAEGEWQTWRVKHEEYLLVNLIFRVAEIQLIVVNNLCDCQLEGFVSMISMIVM